MFLQEKNAIELDKKLGKLFKKNKVNIKKTLDRAGVNSSCDVIYDSRKFHVNCFDNNEYYLELVEEGQVLATGRTYEEGDVLSVALMWLKGGSRELLYGKYPFIDKTLREFDVIKGILSKSQSKLNSQAKINVIHKGCDIYELELQGEYRHCRIYFYGKEDIPRIEFYWSGAYLFQVRTNDYKLLALVFVRWLIDEVAPSDLEKEFAWISTGELAKYYEQGRGLEGEFILSWIDMLDYFSGDDDHNIKVVGFIKSLQKMGYDKTLRAGQSMFTFILSRSRRHGLKSNDSFIAFNFLPDGINVRSNIDRTTEFMESEFKLTHRIEALLNKLAETPIY